MTPIIGQVGEESASLGMTRVREDRRNQSDAFEHGMRLIWRHVQETFFNLWSRLSSLRLPKEKQKTDRIGEFHGYHGECHADHDVKWSV